MVVVALEVVPGRGGEDELGHVVGVADALEGVEGVGLLAEEEAVDAGLAGDHGEDVDHEGVLLVVLVEGGPRVEHLRVLVHVQVERVQLGLLVELQRGLQLSTPSLTCSVSICGLAMAVTSIWSAIECVKYVPN